MEKFRKMLKKAKKSTFDNPPGMGYIYGTELVL